MYLIITNPIAGGGRSLRIRDQVIKRLDAEGIAYELVSTPNIGESHSPNWTAFERSLIIGGDGTLHRILNVWGVPPVAVALISGGSGNDFCRCSLGTASWKEHLDIAINGKPEKIDLGTCNGIWFGTGVGIGFDGRIAYLLQTKSFLKGFARYMAAVLQQVFVYREKEISLQAPSLEYSGKSFMVTVGNTSDFGGGFKVTPDAVPDDGLFQACLVTEVSVPNRLLHLDRVTKGKHRKLRFVRLFETDKLEVSSPQQIHCHMDGEHYFWDRFTIEMKAGSLNLLRGARGS